MNGKGNIALGQVVGQDILDAFGIENRDVVEVELRCVPNEVATLTVTMIARTEEMQKAIKEISEKYHLVKHEPNPPPIPD